MKFSFLTLLKPLIIFVIGLLDDVLLIALSQVGLHVSWLQWLAPVVLCCTVLHYVVHALFYIMWCNCCVTDRISSQVPQLVRLIYEQ